MSDEFLEALSRATLRASVGIGSIDVDGRWLACNPALRDLFGVARGDVSATVPGDLPDLFEGEHRQTVLDALGGLRRGRRKADVRDLQCRRPDGRVAQLRLDLSVIGEREEAAPEALLVLIEDITAANRIQRELETSEVRLRSVIRAMADGVLLIGADRKVELANDRAAELLDRSLDTLRASSLNDFNDLEFLDASGRTLAQEERPVARTVLTRQPQRDVPLGLRDRNGNVRWIEISTEVIELQGTDQPYSVVATFSDITRRYNAERQLRDREEQLSLVIEGAKLGFWDWDLESGEFAFSDAAAERLGYSPDDVAPHRDALLDLVHPEDRQPLIESWAAHLDGTKRDFQMDVRLKRKSGGYDWRLVRGRVVRRNEKDEPSRMAGTVMDIGERKQLEAKLQELATTDGLTGAFNRRHGQERLEAEVDQSHRLGHPVGFVLLDIDHFKQVNDRFGHGVGDRILQRVSSLLRDRVRRTDTVSRWGGEEFAMVLPGTDAAGAAGFAQNVLDGMTVIETPDGVPLSASLGAVSLRKDETATELVRRADRLMYRAKQSGRARVEVELDH